MVIKHALVPPCSGAMAAKLEICLDWKSKQDCLAGNDHKLLTKISHSVLDLGCLTVWIFNTL